MSLPTHLKVGSLRIPTGVAVIAGLTIVATIVAELCERNGVPLASLCALKPRAVWRGEIWRVVTWSFVERSPLDLVFGVMLVYGLGRDLCDRWGSTRFVGVCVALIAAVGVLTCAAVQVLWPNATSLAYIGGWPIEDGLVVAWAATFPDKKITYAHALPVGGWSLVAVTIGLTVLFAAVNGVRWYLPNLLAEVLMLAFVGQRYRQSIRIDDELHRHFRATLREG